MDLKQLKLEIANNFASMGQMHIQYQNKPEFVGYIKNVSGLDGDINDINVTVRKMTTGIGDNSIFDIDFDNIVSITIKYNGSTLIRTFN